MVKKTKLHHLLTRLSEDEKLRFKQTDIDRVRLLEKQKERTVQYIIDYLNNNDHVLPFLRKYDI